MALPHRLQQIVDDLATFEERQDRIEALIALADEYRAQPKPDVPRDEAHRVPGCESEVYMAAEPLGEGLQFRFAVDNPQGISAMALARILDQGLSGEPLRSLLSIPDDLIYTIFGRELSMGKTAGLMGMLERVRAEARKRLSQA